MLFQYINISTSNVVESLQFDNLSGKMELS